MKPLFDYILNEVMTMDFNAELSFDVIKKLSLFRACYEELGWKFTPWVDQLLQRCWKEIHSEHDDVRTYIGEFMSFADKIKVRRCISGLRCDLRSCSGLPGQPFLARKCL